MCRSGFSRRLFAALGSAAVFTMPLSLPGCGGGGSDKPEVVAPKQAPTVSAKDSMSEFLKNRPQPGAKK